MQTPEAREPTPVRSTRRPSELVVASSSRCAPFVVFQQAAKRFVADDLIQSKLVDRYRRRQVAVKGDVADPLMRTELVVMPQPRFEDMSQMAFAEDDEMVQDLRTCAAHPRLGVGI